MASEADTLEELLRTDGLPVDDPALQWMILTWDIALIKGTSNEYCRFLLAGDALLTLYGRRTRSTFSPIASVPGTIGRLTVGEDDSLHEVLTNTAESIGIGGYAMVCNPLAVDCTFFSGATACPAGLLQAIADESSLGIRVLDHVNAARAEAQATHLDAGALVAFLDRTAEELWIGR